MDISIYELLNKKDLNIIDIRNHERYLQSHIPGAINIDSYFLLAYPDKYLKKGEVYYIYCSSGVQSKRVVDTLNHMGYTTINVSGGYKNYLLRS